MNFDPIETVIDLTVSTFGLKDWNWEVEDFVEQIAEGLKLIGAAKIFEDCIHVGIAQSNMVAIPRGVQNIKHIDPISRNYKESAGFIVVDAEDGEEITIHYQGMPLDARGYPVVPDNAPTRQALMWWLARTLILQGHLKSVDFRTAEAEWQWRCGSARADLSVMNLSQWAGFTNDFLRLNPVKDQHAKRYVELGKPNTLDRGKVRLGRFRDYVDKGTLQHSEQKPEE